MNTYSVTADLLHAFPASRFERDHIVTRTHQHLWLTLAAATGHPEVRQWTLCANVGTKRCYALGLDTYRKLVAAATDGGVRPSDIWLKVDDDDEARFPVPVATETHAPEQSYVPAHKSVADFEPVEEPDAAPVTVT